MMIHKIAPSVDNSQWLKRLKTQLNEPTNQNSIKEKLLSQRKSVIIKLWGLV